VVIDAGKRCEWPSRSAEHEGKSLIAARSAAACIAGRFSNAENANQGTSARRER
jgi:hypothetical protein